METSSPQAKWPEREPQDKHTKASRASRAPPLSPGFKWLWNEPKNCSKTLQVSNITMK